MDKKKIFFGGKIYDVYDINTPVTQNTDLYAVFRAVYDFASSSQRLVDTKYSQSTSKSLSTCIRYTKTIGWGGSLSTQNKFEYIIEGGNEKLNASIKQDDIFIPDTADAGIYNLKIRASEKAPMYGIYEKSFGLSSFSQVGLLLYDPNPNYTFEDITFDLTVTVNKSTPTINLLPSKKNLVYTGGVQELITEGSTSGGTMEYSLDGENYSTEIPAAVNAGTYTVYYRVNGGNNYTDIAEESIAVTINQATPDVTAPRAKTLAYTGEAQELITPGNSTAGTIKYSLDGNTYSENIPTATNAGMYNVYYRVDGRDNYHSIKAQSVPVRISAVAEEIPELHIDYVNETLTGFADGASYSINGTEVMPENGSLMINSSYIGKTISVITKARNENHADSAAQEFEISSRPNPPSKEIFTVTQPSTIGGTGSISGITADMECSADGGAIWNNNGDIIGIEGGTSYAVRYKATENSFKSYSCLISINTFNASNEVMPEIEIDYANEMLTGFDIGGNYIIDGHSVIPPNGEVSVSDYMGRTVSIVKKGNGTTTNDSDEQLLNIPPLPDAPAGLESVNESDINMADGKIIGVSEDMEYMAADGEWVSVNGAELTGLERGSYIVRFKSTDTAFASSASFVTIGTTEKYTVRFVNYDDSELASMRVKVGEIPSYNSIPARAENDCYSYEFSGWSPQLAEVMGDVTYTAQFNEIAKEYSITYNTDGGMIGGETDYTHYTYGVGIILPIPSRNGYSFGGWYDNAEFDGEAVMVISAGDMGDKTFYAKWIKNAPTEYMINFVNWNNEPLQSENVAAGTMPEYYGEMPVRKPDERYKYTFIGWQPEISEVTGTATYTAQYEKAEIVYDYSIKYEKGKAIVTVPENGTYTVIFASYADGRLISVSARDTELAKGENEPIEPEQGFNKNGKVRVMLWDSLNGMKPLYRADEN